jgi:hypothetical protein
VLTASFLGEVRSHIGSPDKLPRTLIVHHKQDGCRHTSPSGVQPFKAWGGAKVTVEWMEGGTDVGDPCQAKGYHASMVWMAAWSQPSPSSLQQPASPDPDAEHSASSQLLAKHRC